MSFFEASAATFMYICMFLCVVGVIFLFWYMIIWTIADAIKYALS